MARPSSLLSPRYSLPYLARNRVWGVKNNRLRRLIALRSRRRQRGGLFRRYVLVSTSRKWTEARSSFRPLQYRSGLGRWGGGKVVTGRPQRRRYRDAFYTQQQLRAYHGKLRASAFIRRINKARRVRISSQGKGSQALASQLASRLDALLVRRRIRPTVFAAHQFIRHWGVRVNGVRIATPQAKLNVGDTLSLVAPYKTPLEKEASVNYAVNSAFHPRRRLQVWRTLAWDLLCRIYYRRWGLYTLQRRIQKKRKKRVRPFRIRSSSYAYHQQGLVSLFGGKKSRKWVGQGTSKAFGRHSVKNLATSSALVKNRLPFSAFTPIRGNVANGFAFEQGPSRNAILRHTIRVALALRLRTIGLPRISRLARQKQRNQVESGRAFYFLRPSRRKRLLRSKKGRRRKQARRRGTPRLRPVHRRFPSYLQRDLRTLRAVRLRAPEAEEEAYPFRGTATTIAAFARSRGR